MASPARSLLASSRAMAFRPHTPFIRNALRVSHPPSTSPSAALARTLFTRRKTPPSRARNLIVSSLLLVGGGLFAVYYLDSRSALHRYIVMPVLLRTTDPETAHRFAIDVLKTGLAPRDMVADNELLRTEVFGRTFDNPLGLAAGFDKQAEAIDALFDLGFGLVEVGSVTPEPQPGNPLPRYFRLPEDEAVINRYGFNSEGHRTIMSRLRDRVRRFLLHHSPAASITLSGKPSDLEKTLTPFGEPATTDMPHLLARNPEGAQLTDALGVPRSLRPGRVLAVNLGKNKTSPEDGVEDYVRGVRALGPYADLVVINISSPNTPGLRRLQRRDLLEQLLTSVVATRDTLAEPKPPLLVKVAPDMSENELEDVASAVLSTKADGIIVSNTTVSRPGALKSTDNITQAGGLSGPPLKPLSLQALSHLHRVTGGRVPLIGCGGISTGEDALDYARAGASLVEIYTSFGYGGVGVPRRIKDEIVDALKKEGKSWTEIVGDRARSIESVRLDGRLEDVGSGLPQGGPGLLPTTEKQFDQAVKGVKAELDDLRAALSRPESTPSYSTFQPNEDDDLLARVHAALAMPEAFNYTRSPENVETTVQDPSPAPAVVALESAIPSAVVSSGEPTDPMAPPTASTQKDAGAGAGAGDGKGKETTVEELVSVDRQRLV